MKPFVCQKCGKCCREIPINVGHADILRWLKEKRYDILDEISYIEAKKGFYFTKTIRKPTTGCPFLKDNECGIYDTRPNACADFPHAHSTWKKCPAWKEIGYRVDILESHTVANLQREDYRLAEDKKHLLIHFLFLARDRKGEEIDKLLDPLDPDETLWCTTFDSTYTDWTPTGTSPYLSDSDSNYITSSTKKADEGWFGFADTAYPTSTLNSVYLYLEGQSNGSDIEDLEVSDGSGTQAYTVTFPASMGYATPIDLSAFINTWGKVDACTFRITKENNTNTCIVRRAYLFCNYTEESTEYQKTFDVDALFQKLGLTQTLDIDVLLKKQDITKTFDIDTAIMQPDNVKSFDIDAALRKLDIPKSFDIDTRLLKAVVKTIDIDALLKKLDIVRTADIDAIFVNAIIKTFNTDVVLKKAVEKAFNIDGAFKQSDIIKSINIDVILTNAVTKQFLIDIIIKKPDVVKSFDIDTILNKQYIKSFDIDAILKKAVTVGFLIDVLLEPAEGTWHMTMNGTIVTSPINCLERGFDWGVAPSTYIYEWTEEGSYGTGPFSHYISGLTADTIYFRAKARNAAGWGYGSEQSANKPTGAITKSFTIDALFKKLGIVKTADIDVMFQEQDIETSMDIDVLLQKLDIEKTAPVDVLFKKLGAEAQFDIDVLIQKAFTSTFDIDAVFKKLDVLASFGIDTDILKQNIVKSFLIDVRLAQAEANLLPWNIDVLFKKYDVTKTFDIDSAFQTKDTIASYLLDVLFQKTNVVSRQIDALFKKAFVQMFDIDTVLSKSYTKFIQIDVALLGFVTKTFTIDCYIGSSYYQKGLISTLQQVGPSQTTVQVGPSQSRTDKDPSQTFGEGGPSQLAEESDPSQTIEEWP